MERFKRSRHASTLVLLAGFSAAVFALGGDQTLIAVGSQTAVVSGIGSNSPVPVNTTAFTIGGELQRPLAPGRTVPMNLRLTNTTHVDLTLSALTIRVAGLSTTDQPSTPTTCAVDNFTTRGARLSTASFVLKARTAGTLRSLGLPRWRWPRLAMINRRVNQNECRNVSLALSYDGASRPVQK